MNATSADVCSLSVRINVADMMRDTMRKVIIMNVRVADRREYMDVILETSILHFLVTESND